MTDEQNKAADRDGGEPRTYSLQRIYIKDMSFESPKSPEIFQGEWKPALSVNIGTRARALADDHFEVVLTVTLEAKQDDSVAFLVELQQAGVFHIAGHTEEERKYILGILCPQNLFPFAREEIATLTLKGGFPQILLQPVNFERAYQQSTQQAVGEA